MTGATWVRTALWAMSYVAAVLAGRQLVLPDSGISLFWPAAGVAAMWFALHRSWRERLVASGLVLAVVGGVIGHEVGGQRAVWWALANLLQAVVVAGLLRRRPGLGPDGLTHLRQLAPRNTREVAGLASVSVFAATLGSVVGTLGAYADGVPISWLIPLSWVVRNSTGMFAILTVVATLLVLHHEVRPDHPGWSRRLGSAGQRQAMLELLLAFATTALITVAVFGERNAYPIAFLVLPCAVWFGTRFVPGIASLNAAIQGLLVIGFSIAGRGPFAAEMDLQVRALTVQLFFLLCFVLGLLLSISVAERQALLARALRSEAHAMERAELVSAVTRVMHEGLIVVDRRGEVVMSNPAAHAMLGEQASRLRLGDASDVDGSRKLDGSIMSADERPALRALRGEVVDQLDLARIDPATGAASVLSCSAVPMDVPGGERVAVLCLTDVTEDRARLAELKGFAGVIAHDLKGPVAGVRGWAEILDDQLDDLEGDVDAARATLLRMQTSAARTQELIDDLLNYARAGTGDLFVERTTLASVWAQAREQLSPVSGDGCEIRYAEGDDEVEVDVVLVRQLLVNLVGNALKYVAPGVIPQVRISSKVVDGRLQVEVRDNGIGIPLAEQGRVFEGFVRSSRTGSYPGTGLGLAICARAVQRHGGTIGARDAGPGGGTLITFTLPRPSAEPETPETPEVAPASVATATVLADVAADVPLEVPADLQDLDPGPVVEPAAARG